MYYREKSAHNPAFFFAPPPPLDILGEITRAIFYGHHNNSFSYFSVNAQYQSEPVLHLRAHGPVRFFSKGLPLLSLSVVDHQVARKLVANGKLDPDHFQSEFSRIFSLEENTSSSRAIGPLSMEEVDLFRYALRVNSAKVKPSTWQIENLPLDEESPSPWMTTFVSPQYSVFIANGCSVFTDGIKQLLASGKAPQLPSFSIPAYNEEYCPYCAHCFVKYVAVKRCSRCNYVSYCSVECQKKHWITHK